MEGASSRCDHRPTLKSVHILYCNAISLLPKFDEPCAVAEAPVLMLFALLSPGCPMKFKTINELAIDNYQILRLNKNRYGGSFVMYIHSSLSYQICQLEPKSWVLIVSVSTLYGKFSISLFYRSPSSNVEIFESLCTALFPPSFLYIKLCNLYQLRNPGNPGSSGNMPSLTVIVPGQWLRPLIGMFILFLLIALHC